MYCESLEAVPSDEPPLISDDNWNFKVQYLLAMGIILKWVEHVGFLGKYPHH